MEGGGGASRRLSRGPLCHHIARPGPGQAVAMALLQDQILSIELLV